MTRHLAKCLPAHEPAAETGKGKATRGKRFHVVVEGKYSPSYWLHLEIPATAKLQNLDRFLRHIWLECCGHMSAFKLEGQKRTRPSLASLMTMDPMEWEDPDDLDMEQRVGDIFRKGSKLSYEYDFGSTTALSIKVVGEREGLIDKPNDVCLLARNEPPAISCGLCHQGPATIIDMENAYDESGWLCDACAEKEGLSREEMTLPVVNSPRTGVCGYTGN
jgi:hypothetical protein